MACANSFVKNEMQETEVAYTPTDGFYNVVYPCRQCGNAKSITAKPWQSCMRKRRSCFRKGEEHPLPTIRRVHVTEVRQSPQDPCFRRPND